MDDGDSEGGFKGKLFLPPESINPSDLHLHICSSKWLPPYGMTLEISEKTGQRETGVWQYSLMKL